MSTRDYVGGEWFDILPHVEDELRKDKQMYCSNSILAVGDPVKVIGPECTGQVGELAVIEDEDVYGVWLDTVGQQMFFSADEIERVELEVDMAELPF